MKTNAWVLLACAVAFMTSCSTVVKTSSSCSVAAQASSFPTVADIEVQPKVSAEVELGFVPFNLGQPSVSDFKANTVAEILQQNKADVLLEPEYSYSRKPFGPRRLVVTGYPARFGKFRQATEEDLKALGENCPAHRRKIYRVKMPRFFKKGKTSVF